VPLFLVQFFFVFFFFGGTGVWIKNFIFAKQELIKQVLYCLSHTSSPFGLVIL
jgi:hypothetical protein